jgi:hypothetical protein
VESLREDSWKDLSTDGITSKQTYSAYFNSFRMEVRELDSSGS